MRGTRKKKEVGICARLHLNLVGIAFSLRQHERLFGRVILPPPEFTFLPGNGISLSPLVSSGPSKQTLVAKVKAASQLLDPE
jgi:hypothetical protein